MVYKIPRACTQCGKYFHELYIVRDRLTCLPCDERILKDWNALIRTDQLRQ